MSKLIASPCIAVCALDEQDLCIGCYRSVAEITNWSDYSEEQKRDVLALCAQRAKQANPFALS